MDVLVGLVGLDDPRIILVSAYVEICENIVLLVDSVFAFHQDLDHSVRKLKSSSRSEEIAVYGANDSVSGTVSLFVNGSLKYSRISIELRGETATYDVR